MARSTMPWSLKGVSAEARGIARDAAARQGVTIGEWISGAIRDVGDPGKNVPEAAVPADEGTEKPVTADDADDREAAFRQAVRERVYANEERIARTLAPLQDLVTEMSRRLIRLEEQAADDGAHETSLPKPPPSGDW